MIKRYKDDIKTIIEVLIIILINFSFSFIHNTLLNSIFLLIWVVIGVYNINDKIQYRLGNRPNTIRFPTLNDNFTQTTTVTLGCFMISISIIGNFISHFNILYVIIGLATGIIVFLNGFFYLPNGWLSIENSTIGIYGIKEKIDSRQLKQIELQNNQVILTNIYGEHKVSTLLNLNPLTAENLRKYIEQKLHNNNSFEVINNVQ